MQLQISDAAMHQVAQSGFNPQYGARPLATAIRSLIRRPLSRKIISGEVSTGSTVQLSINDDGVFEWKIDK